MSPLAAGAIAIVLVLSFAYFAYTKDNPFSNPYELNAVVEHANELKPRSPVRVAGVRWARSRRSSRSDERSSGTRGVRRMEIDDDEACRSSGTPRSRSAADLPRGQLLRGASPGSPSAEEIESGSTLPPNQASDAGPVSTRCSGRSSATRARTSGPSSTSTRRRSRGRRARASTRRSALGGGVPRQRWLVRGLTSAQENHDLSRCCAARAACSARCRATRTRSRARDEPQPHRGGVRAPGGQPEGDDPAAARRAEGRPPGAPVAQQPLPSLRAFAREALPGARRLAHARRADPASSSSCGSSSPRRAQGLANDLREAVPDLVKLNQGSTKTFRYTRALSACQNNVLVPFAKEPIPIPTSPATTRTTTTAASPGSSSSSARSSASGESRLFDANSSFFRVQGGGGPTRLDHRRAGRVLLAPALYPIEGVRPISAGRDLAEVPPRRPVRAPGGARPARRARRPGRGADQPAERPQRHGRHARATARRPRVEEAHRPHAPHGAGQPPFDPMAYKGALEERDARKLGPRVRTAARLAEGGRRVLSAIRKHLRDFVAILGSPRSPSAGVHPQRAAASGSRSSTRSRSS